MVGLGGWLFTWRTSIPVPLVLALLLIPSGRSPWTFVVPGTLVVLAGELLRMWAVRQIGAISRTRSDRLGPLVDSGPFALVRNPLYIGNIALWTGFTIAADIPWFAPVAVLALGFVYHPIVRWEETLLASRLGEGYRAYCARVPRWIPRIAAAAASAVHDDRVPFSWRATIFSERGTLIAIAVGYALLWLKFALA
jgi:protein-S-isoprenylcysteine O-methyltransferase Ste14